MAKIAFILLTHKDPDGIIAQAQRLTATGDYVSIHFDARAKPADFEKIRSAFADNPSVTFAARRLKCGWGEWSLVAATLEAVKAAVAAFPEATHFYMLSGDCMQIKTAEFAHAFLDATDVDYIESFDFFASDWIKTGIRQERLIYRHWFNERSRKWWFYTSLEWQKRLGLHRAVPFGLRMRIGSQWWCLRRSTVGAVLDYCRANPSVLRFFRTTWIPDETFFQTVVAHLIPEAEIRSRPLTFLMFTDYGMPVTFYNDHYDLLLAQDYLFARKISPEAQDLRRRLGALYTETGRDFAISNEGRRLFAFLTARGRVGRRIAPRFWERDSSLGRDRVLMMVTCKKWHVAKRLVDRVRQVSNIPALDYLFNEEAASLPDLGGIEGPLAKRTRHRRALVRMLYDYWQTDRLVFCVDPANVDLMQDFLADKAQVRLLEIECLFDDSYLMGHARRVGLAGDTSGPAVLERLLPTIRYDFQHERERIRDAGFPRLYHLRETASIDENALQLAEFLDIPAPKAREIAATDYLFVD